MKNIRTDCDIEKERLCRNKRLKFILSLQKHREFVNKMILKSDAEKLYKLSMQFCILENTKMNIYPAQFVKDIQGEILNKKYRILIKIKEKIMHIIASYAKLRQKYQNFYLSSQILDWNTDSSLLKGNAREKPLTYYLDNCMDVLIYYSTYQKHVWNYYQKLSLHDINSIDEFSKSLIIDDKFNDYLDNILLNSRCFINDVKKK